MAFGGGGSSTPETLAHTHNQALAGDGGDLSETLTDMNGVALYSLITDNSAAVAANTAAIAAQAPFLVPAGVVLMWSGAVVDIPTGWDLCDGTAGTVNLSNRFVRSGTSIGTTGGADTVTLTGAESGLVAHSHTSSVSDSGHSHSIAGGTSSSQGSQAKRTATSTSPISTASATTGIGVTVNAVVAADASSAHENMPSYYELAYIQKS